MTLEKRTAEINRNIGVLRDLETASAVRVAYKTKAGWKRLRVPKRFTKSLRSGAAAVVDQRLNRLLDEAVTLAFDRALEELVDGLNG